MDVLTLNNPPEVIAARTATIHDALQRESRHLRSSNFEVIGVEDLALLFRLYDEQFFGGWLDQTVREKAVGPLMFRLSSTMTRAGGKTIRRRRPGPDGSPRDEFEIAIAGRLLFLTFGDVHRPVVVGGLSCADRLQALQRIMEHEIIHLAESLVWGCSQCSAPRFKGLARRIFGHTASSHNLVTPREQAARQHAVVIGSLVEFTCQGLPLLGRVNRVHQRATVLVAAEDGMPYSDGKRYRKYYVPLPLLRSAQASRNA